MAATEILLDLEAFSLPDRVYLQTTAAGQVAADALGYALADTGEGWEFAATVPEACDGVYRLVAKDASDVIVATGYIRLADTVGPFRAFDSLIAAAAFESDGTLADATVTDIAEQTAAEVDATGTGATLVEVTVLDDSAVAVAAANVNIYASDGSPLGIYALTDVAGKVQFQLNDGDYLAGISAQSAFEPHTPQAFTVAPANIVGGKIPVALTFTRTASIPPVDPALCRVKFNVMDASGAAAADVTISATPVSRAMTVPTKVLTLIAATATTDVAGYAELLLPRADAINSAGSKAYRITLRKDGSGVYDVVEKAIPNTGETTFDVVVNS